MSTRLRYSLPVAVGAALVLGLSGHAGTASAAPAGAPATVAAAGSTAFGSTVQWRKGETFTSSLARVEAVSGTLGVARIFQTTPQPKIFAPLGARSAVVSFKLPPDLVLAGVYDAQFRAFFAAAPKDHPTWWSYYHEADAAFNQGRLNDFQQFRDASSRVARIARSAGNGQLRNTVILTGYTANPKSGKNVADYLPAAGLTDLVAFDNYNGWAQSNLGTYGDPTTVLGHDKAAAAAVGLPWAVAEFASTVQNGDYQGRADFITRFAQVAATNGAVFVSYFDSKVGAGGTEYRLLDAPSQDAFRAIVSDQNPF
ncbi:MAG TPA: hypothetical protein VFR07_13020 [Mycobacteriales bacterium]|jgi:hypothetical protein|nr:hypothetical protein [Mycobacteriales bacterium]